MEQSRIDRINQLARKAKTEGLTPGETEEREALRREYLASVRRNLRAQLDNIYLVDAQGRETKLKRRDET